MFDFGFFKEFVMGAGRVGVVAHVLFNFSRFGSRRRKSIFLSFFGVGFETLQHQFFVAYCLHRGATIRSLCPVATIRIAMGILVELRPQSKKKKM